MSETLVWWVMMQVVGLSALPLCLALFRRLPDWGYALSKPFALLGTGYVFWVLNVMHVLPNSAGGIAWVLLLFALASGYLFWRRRDELLAFAREHLLLIGVTEALFFLAFVTAAYLRSFVPEIAGTEKPMDFMFLNAVTRADRFPPEDAWLAGQNVAYYYFGYLLVSVMTRLSGLETSVGYNLGLAMIVALAVTAAFGLVYNLAALREQRAAEGGPGTAAAGFSSGPFWRPVAFGVVAALLLAVMGNLEGLLEWLAAHGVGSSSFWSWADIKDGELAGYDSTRWYPDQHWFWWRATRILDHGTGIHEFPFFSFQLGDLHPHVMSIPFVLLALGAALALLRSEGPLDLVFWLERPLWLVALAVVLGALAFLNTWDMPTTALVITLAVLVRNRLLAGRWSRGLALDTAGFVLPLFLAAFLAYTPFFFGGFDSQASGFTAEAGDGSGLFHMLLIWGPFAAIVLPYAAWRLAASGGRITAGAVLWSLAPAYAIVLLWLVWDLLAGLFGWLPAGLQPNEAAAALGTRIGDRGFSWLTALALAGSLGLVVLALAREVEAAGRDEEGRLPHVFALGLAATAGLLILGTEFFFIDDTFDSRMNTIFKLYYQSWLLLSIAGGFALYELARGWRPPAVRVPGAVAVDLSLGGWGPGELAVVAAIVAGAIAGVVATRGLLGGLVGAVALGGAAFAASGAGLLLWRAGAGRSSASPGGALGWRGVWAGSAAVFLLAAFVYPLVAGFSRTNDFDLPRSLDGLAYLKQQNPDEYEAIRWLYDRDGQPVIAEALGDDYTDAGRVSASTGLPTPLQWPGHQLQWRGTSDPQTGRPEDLEQLYSSTDPNSVRAIIQKYGIAYVFLGPAEQQRYPELALPQMEALVEPAFQQGQVTVYRVKPGILGEARGGSP